MSKQTDIVSHTHKGGVGTDRHSVPGLTYIAKRVIFALHLATLPDPVPGGVALRHDMLDPGCLCSGEQVVGPFGP